MAKKVKETKSKVKKNRSYKVHHDGYGVPYIIIKGKFLEDMDLGIGTQLQMIETDTGFTLQKLTDDELMVKEAAKWQLNFKRRFKLCVQHLESCVQHQIAKQIEHEQFLNHLIECERTIDALQTMRSTNTHEIKTLGIISDYKLLLAKCLRTFRKLNRSELINIDIEVYTQLLTLLRDCGLQFGIISNRKLSFEGKSQSQTVKRPYLKGQAPSAAVAEKRETSYSVDAEIVNNPERYLQA